MVLQAVTNYHRLAALGLLLVALAGAYWLIARPVVLQYQFYQNTVESLQDRLQRFDRMLATRQELEARIRRIRQDSSVDDYYLKQQSPTLAATEAQQKIKSFVEANGGHLVSTQILPVVQESAFFRVAISVQMTGDMAVLQKVIYALETGRPLLFISNLQVRANMIRRPGREYRAGQVETSLQLTIQFELAGYLRRGQA